MEKREKREKNRHIAVLFSDSFYFDEKEWPMQKRAK